MIISYHVILQSNSLLIPCYLVKLIMNVSIMSIISLFLLLIKLNLIHISRFFTMLCLFKTIITWVVIHSLFFVLTGCLLLVEVSFLSLYVLVGVRLVFSCGWRRLDSVCNLGRRLLPIFSLLIIRHLVFSWRRCDEVVMKVYLFVLRLVVAVVVCKDLISRKVLCLLICSSLIKFKFYLMILFVAWLIVRVCLFPQVLLKMTICWWWWKAIFGCCRFPQELALFRERLSREVLSLELVYLRLLH